MDLGKIIDEIVPWLVLLGMFVPYLKKLRKAQKVADAKRRTVQSAPRRMAPVQRESTPSLPRTLDPSLRVSNAAPIQPVAAPLPDEGVRTTPDAAPMQMPAARERGRRARELRSALVWNEILTRKY